MKPLHPKHVEAFLKAAGIHGRKAIMAGVSNARPLHMVGARLPWLLLGLIGGMVATGIIKWFSATLEQELALAFFIPVIVYMADAVGTQTETLFIRKELLGLTSMRRYVVREAAVGAMLALFLAIPIFPFAYLLFHQTKLAFVVSLSLFVTVFTSVFVAIGIPFCLLKMKKDPALGSGPFATVIQDILSIIIYFVIATILL